LSAGTTIGLPIELLSLAHTRVGRPNISTPFNNSASDWLKRKFVTGLVTFPFSIRNVPSRVSPVCTMRRGLSGRMYQKRVSRTPRVTDLIRSSSDASPPLITKFDIGGLDGTFCLLAQNRE